MFRSITRFAYSVVVLTMVASYSVAMPADPPPTPKDDKAAQSQPVKPAEKPAAANSQPTPSPAGMVVSIDPATGQIRQPTPAEVQTLVSPGGPGTRAPSTGTGIPVTSIPFVTADGVPGVRLGQNSMSYVVVTRTPDGKLVEDCVTGDKAAAARLGAPIDVRSAKEPSKAKEPAGVK